MKIQDIAIGKTYRYGGLTTLDNPDRTVIWIGEKNVQYKETETPPWPTVTLLSFARWAKGEV